MIDWFIFEITHTVLNTIKVSHNTLELSKDVIIAASKIILRVQKVFQLKYDLLLKERDDWAVASNLNDFIE